MIAIPDEAAGLVIPVVVLTLVAALNVAMDLEFQRRREQRQFERELNPVKHQSSLLEALLIADPCDVGVFEADELYPRVLERVAARRSEIRSESDLRSAVTSAIISLGGPPPDPSRISEVVRLMRAS